MSFKDKTNIWIFVSAGLAIIMGVLIYFIFSQHKEISDVRTQILIEEEKRELEKEYANLAIEYDQFEGNRLLISNDSLVMQFENEKIKVQRLLEELKTTKASNAKRIAELKGELSSLRAIMRGYIIQIDSLNALNEKLVAENRAVTTKYQAITETADRLQKDKEQLSEKVTLASKLNTTNVSVVALNRNKKDTEKLSRAEYFECKFSIAKNVTATPGERYVYLRIVKPDGDILTKDVNNTFKYEDSDVPYSSKRLISYSGEVLNVDIYWTIEEFLYPGLYEFELFCDGEMIGSSSISMKK